MKKIIFIIIAVLSLSGCTSKNNDAANGKDSGTMCEIYYASVSGQQIESEIASIEGKTQEEQINAVFEKMKSIPSSEERRSVVPEKLKINTIGIDSGILHVDFNGVYRSMSAGEELAFKSAVVYTFTSLDYVDYVSITVDGSPIRTMKGQSVLKIGRDDIVMDGNISAEPTNYEILTLYFKTLEGTRLGTEIKEVEVNPNLPIERYVIEQLIKGTENPLLKNVVPSDTKIREISTADGICYVDLSAEFVTKQTGSEADIIAAVYSIVNSLTEIEHISKVQFLIDGEKADTYKNTVDISKPVEAQYDISFE